MSDKGNDMDPHAGKDHDIVPEAHDRLAELGLSWKLLRRCLEHGQYAGDETTANHPRIAEGFYVWAETNRVLRDSLVKHDWTKNEESNIPRTVAPDGSFCVVAVSGEEGTGIQGANPGTKNPRGTAGIATVERNRQLELFPEMFSDSRPNLVRTWYLLYFRRGDTLFAELVLPTRVDQLGGIRKWEERIVLPRLDLSPGDVGGEEDNSGSHEEVEVPVKRRDA